MGAGRGGDEHFLVRKRDEHFIVLECVGNLPPDIHLGLGYSPCSAACGTSAAIGSLHFSNGVIHGSNLAALSGSERGKWGRNAV